MYLINEIHFGIFHVNSHFEGKSRKGLFTWGKDVKEAAYHAVVLETVAEMALKTFLLSPDARIQNYILEKHYERKHGPHAYYGQVK